MGFGEKLRRVAGWFCLGLLSVADAGGGGGGVGGGLFDMWIVDASIWQRPARD